MRRITAVTAVVVTLAAGFIAGGAWSAHRSGSAHASAHAASLYTCPMHPDYRSERPGNCPICGMPIVAKHAGADSQDNYPKESATALKLGWLCMDSMTMICSRTQFEASTTAISLGSNPA